MKNYIIPYGERFINMGMGYKRTLMCVDNLGLVVRHSLETTPAPEDVRNYLVGWNEQNTILIQADSLQDALLKFYDFPGSKTGTQGKKGSYERSRIPDELCREILINALDLYRSIKDPSTIE